MTLSINYNRIKDFFRSFFAIVTILFLIPIMLVLAIGIRGYETLSHRSSDNLYVYSNNRKQK